MGAALGMREGCCETDASSLDWRLRLCSRIWPQPVPVRPEPDPVRPDPPVSVRPDPRAYIRDRQTGKRAVCQSVTESIRQSGN